METVLNQFIAFFKKYKDAIYISLIIIAITIIFILLRFKKEEGLVVNPPTDNHDLIDTVKYLRTENGRLYAQLHSKTVEWLEADARVDSLSRELKIKPRYIKGQDVYIYKTDTILIPQVINTTPEGKDYTFVDDYLYLKLDIPENKPPKFTIQSVDTLTRVEKSHTNIFGKTTTDIYIRNANPYNKIEHGYSFTRKEKRVWLTIGPSIQVNPFTKKVDVGLSVQVPIIQLKR